MKYRIYIDEVGNPDLESSSDPNHRFLSLTGVIVELGHVQSIIHPQMEALKARYFDSHPDEPIIFHRKEMLNCKPPFDALKDEQTRQQFDDELLDLIRSWQYHVISVCLDKKKHRKPTPFGDTTPTITVWQYCWRDSSYSSTAGGALAT